KFRLTLGSRLKQLLHPASSVCARSPVTWVFQREPSSHVPSAKAGHASFKTRRHSQSASILHPLSQQRKPSQSPCSSAVSATGNAWREPHSGALITSKQGAPPNTSAPLTR